ncbi:putative ubiquitin-conjugating enzyme protein [Phaeoacremonium minimum UCRPA7]|uniref:Putative ubiquitin-conjugating enzyme protein n=1 Tax=Phaeoacremonium minimum (strain UCR-PA7) TaxID=1286976 RepID=R8BH88_PHAM7|nr:putative ubiquitin-conjugating enzyme protein [Phaeoacremonium minimum UCRPA7]EON98666.1 putative ubiquitin-conjugating enzyme protein [Phaeoacremonium minimum UCRPA7]
MATPKFNSKSPTIRRILREAQELSSAPSPDYTATPLESDLFEWHFTLRGPPNSVYSDGIYHGRIVLPPSYPLRPPSFRFVTPSGRFEANREICLSISGHHEETWQPAWGVRTALVALRSFMETDPKGQLGGLDTSDAVRRRLANESGAFRCSACGKTNAEIIKECEDAAKEASDEAGPSAEVEIPKDLKMGWRDEMEKPKAASPAAAVSTEAEAVAASVDDAESAELAEGFVQTVPIQRQEVPVDTASLPARPGQTVPQPTRTLPLPDPQAAVVPPLAQAQLHRHSNDGVPLWIDRTIVALAILLIGMIFKVMLGI